MQPPEYFESIRREASETWDTLQDENIAGPWHQLFKQVQSPRHVISELLQNADDAGAEWAKVEITDNEFIFSHNGKDFNKEQFESLCRFGFSNKRALHTIGFRGVGFKSTFSLGDEVRLVTDTLSVTFKKKRFTEPLWTESNKIPDGCTEIRVHIKNQQVRKGVMEHLREWRASSASLLFFNHIRRLILDKWEIRWESQGKIPVEDFECQSMLPAEYLLVKSQGTVPVKGPERTSESNTHDNRFLVFRSSEEEFPEDALREIKEERMTADDDTPFPPCQVEIVLGMEGRLFVVLPTGVITGLPFACNAPFIQDPARMKIKDPSLSPTNKWLLERTGKLAASAMLAWVGNKDLPIEERCRAYDLLPNASAEYQGDIEKNSGAIVKEGFKSKIKEKEFLLTETGTLESSGKCLAVPGELFDVWSSSQISTGFSMDNMPILSRHISAGNRENLNGHEYVESLDKPRVIGTLKENKRLPSPRSWQQLLHLWHYVRDTLYYTWHHDVKIVPVRGKEDLYAAAEVIRLGENQAINLADQEFLAPHFLQIDPEWIKYLESKRNAISKETAIIRTEEQVRSAYQCLSELGLTKVTPQNQFVRMVTESFLVSEAANKIGDHVRLAHIIAKLGATAPDNFKWITQDAQVQDAGSNILADIQGNLDMFVDKDWYVGNVLHDEYFKPSETCTESIWSEWVRSRHSRLYTFIPIVQRRIEIIGKKSLKKILERRGFKGDLHYHYKYENFCIEDWDFDPKHWQYWHMLAKDDKKFWSGLMSRILEQPQSYWQISKSASVSQQGTSNRTRPVTDEQVVPEWIMKFHGLPCLLDTWGKSRQPAELFMSTPETEPYRDVEHFVKAGLDTESTQPLLRLLGVRDSFTDPKPILIRLKALAKINPPLLQEVKKCYHSLDQIFDRCSASDVQEIKAAFTNSALILTDQDGWAYAYEAFLNPDPDDLLKPMRINLKLLDLPLWRKIGVQERPTADMEINRLKELPSGEKINTSQIKHVQRVVHAYPCRIWYETRHWLNMEKKWTPIENLKYSLTSHSSSLWKHLFPESREKTADLRLLLSETCKNPPFSDLARLEDVIEERFQERAGLLPPQDKPWLIEFGTRLQRIVLDDPVQMEGVRNLSRRLSQTKWQVARELKSVPYIDGAPVGTPRSVDVLWRDNILYVQEGSSAKIIGLVIQEITAAFDQRDITEAIKLCYERPPNFIREYLESNFKMTSDLEGCKPDEPDTQVVQSDNGEDPYMGIEPSEPGQIPDEHTYPSDDYKPKPRPPRRKFIERFAQLHGFTMDEDGRFVHNKNGSSLEKTLDNPFPWVYKSSQGVTLQHFWPKEHCMQKRPLEINVEIWEYIKQSPEKYSLLLTDINDNPYPISGNDLIKMHKKGELILYPSTYRLKYSDEHKSLYI